MTPLTPADVANLYGVSDQTVRHHCRSGNLPAQDFSGRWLIDQDDAAAFAAQIGWKLDTGEDAL